MFHGDGDVPLPAYFFGSGKFFLVEISILFWIKCIEMNDGKAGIFVGKNSQGEIRDFSL